MTRHKTDDRSLTEAEREFTALLTSSLPPVIARKEVSRFLGGIMARKTMAKLDEAGLGPEVAYKVGRSVVYRTDSLVAWLVRRSGVERMVNIMDL
ncbi:MAG: hypothetical protein LBH14_03340 [Desulfobulbaceae bacterium]|jgi:hypothetical protein|nr:hypothetical protein [Desulfobulbaceae bacterium]